MKLLITIFSLGLFLNVANAQSFKPVKPINVLKNTDISGFYVGQDVKEATDKICKDEKKGLGYSVVNTDAFGNKRIDVTDKLFVVKCMPKSGYGESKYWKETEGKPTLVSLLIKDNQVAGIHLIFSHKKVFKRAIVNLTNSTVFEDTCSNSQPPGYDVSRYDNLTEDWNAWVLSPVGRKIVNGVMTRMMYIVHVEANLL